jgi:hypothetical protein
MQDRRKASRTRLETKPAEKISIADIRRRTDAIRRKLTCVQLDLPQYNGTEFRLGYVEQAERMCANLRVLLEAQLALENAGAGKLTTKDE